jgi:ferredoxin
MENKVKVKYFKKLCVGQGSCEIAANTFFKLKEGKAELLGANESKEGLYELDINCDESTLKKLIDAGDSCPVNAIVIQNIDTDETLVSNVINKDEAKEVIAQYDDATEFILDEKGYFLIRINKEKQNVEVGFCNSKNKIILKVIGKKPIDIYTTILNKEGLGIRTDHAAYLGRELQKAYIALKHNLDYIQDDELVFN